MRALLFVFSRLGALVYLMTHPRVPLWVKALPVLAFLYFIWPVDLLFDFPPGIGHIDDFIVIMVLLNAFFWLARPYTTRPPPSSSDGKIVQAEFHVIDPEDRGQDNQGQEDQGQGAQDEDAKGEDEDKEDRS